MPGSTRAPSTGSSARSWTGNFERSEQASEVLGIHWLDQVRGKSRFLRALPVLRLAVPGERDHHARSYRQRLHATRDLVAVEPGQADVDQRHLGRLRASQVEALGAVGTGVDLVAVQLEQRAQGLTGVGVVLDEEGTGHCPTVSRAPRRFAPWHFKRADDI